jgi:mono/diheme cytochrome c family protein
MRWQGIIRDEPLGEEPGEQGASWATSGRGVASARLARSGRAGAERRLARGICAATALSGALAFIGCGVESLETRPGPVMQKAAPPISGGTLIRVADSTDGDDLYVAADPDTDQIHLVRFFEGSRTTIDLEVGDEPGRVVAGDGKAFVALRGSGDLLSLDLASGAIARLAVCPAPRGLAFDEGLVHVACAGGELLSVKADLTGVTRKLKLDRDLRDVVIQPDGGLAVSVFRSAEVLFVDGEGVEQHRVPASTSVRATDSAAFEPAVAWRTIPIGDGQLMMLHQRGLASPIPSAPTPSPSDAYYGGADASGCASSAILDAAATIFDAAQNTQNEMVLGSQVLGALVLPVDLALSPDGKHFAAVGAGSAIVVHGPLAGISDVATPTFSCPQSQGAAVSGDPIAVTFANAHEVVVQRRLPAGLVRVDVATKAIVGEVLFEGPSRRDVGHMFFHQAASPMSAIACASCHPEGRDDGRVWQFETLGARRTQTVAGGILDTTPLHWDGDLTDLGHLMSKVFVERMGGTAPTAAQLDSLAAWMQTIPRLPRSEPAESGAVSRGELLFHDGTVGCAACHSGEKLTNHLTMDVGTGKAFQVPSLLGIADRAPFMHDGCAPTLKDRFDSACGGGDLHGVTSHLSEAQLADLVAYLETL